MRRRRGRGASAGRWRLDGIDFTIERGSLVGYLGPNGAGKSTTVKMLTGILVPSGGRIRVAGLDPARQRVELARRIGVVFGQRSQLWWDLPLRESFDLLRHIYRVPEARHRANLDRFTEVLALAPFLDTPVRQLSLGQRMRGELTAALLHDPEIVFLDEPTTGSTSSRRWPYVSSSARSTGSARSPSCSRPTTSPTSSGSALGS